MRNATNLADVVETNNDPVLTQTISGIGSRRVPAS
jgi:hypothetical protein